MLGQIGDDRQKLVVGRHWRLRPAGDRRRSDLLQDGALKDACPCVDIRHRHAAVDALFLATAVRRRRADRAGSARTRPRGSCPTGEHPIIDVVRPCRLGRREIERRRLRLDDRRQRMRSPLSSGPSRRQRSIDDLRSIRPAIQAGMRDRRREIADQRRSRAALRDRALGRVVRHRDRCSADRDHAIRPALGGHTGLLARHEFECAVGAEMQHRVGAEIIAQPAIEGREGVRRRKALFEQQTHRIAFVAERAGWMPTNTFPKRSPSTKIAAPSVWCLPGAEPHCASISASARGARGRWRGCARARLHARRSARRCRRPAARAAHRHRPARRPGSPRASSPTACGAATRTRRDAPPCPYYRHSAGS
jgi:hypothetical protein